MKRFMMPSLLVGLAAASLAPIAFADEAPAPPRTPEKKAPKVKDPAKPDTPATAPENPLESLLADKSGQLARLAESILGKDGGNRLFYFPTKDQPFTPKKYGCQYEDVHFKSADGTELHGWFLPAKTGAEKAKATIVFSHGNAGSVAHHLGFIDWLMPAGYNVLLYDYRAFGQSKGTLSRKGIVEDVTAAFNYIVTRKDVDSNNLVSFAHSLGGAKSVAAIAMKPIKGLRAIISDSTFTSYKEMGRLKGGQVGANLTTDELSTINYIDQLAPVPLLVIHGTQDKMIPLAQGEALFKKAKEPKTFFKVENGSHTNSLSRNGGEYRKKMLAWLDKVLG